MDINLDTNIDDLIRDNLKDIGARIKDIRKRLRISQIQMAETINITNSYLSDIETGKGNPGHSFFFKLAMAYEVSLNYLFLGKGEIFLETTRPNNPDDPKFPNIWTIEDLCWYMVRSPIFSQEIISYAAKFRYEHKNLIEMDMDAFHSVRHK